MRVGKQFACVFSLCVVPLLVLHDCYNEWVIVAWCCKRDGIRDEGKSIYAFQAMKSLQFQKHGFRESTSSSSFQFPKAHNTVVYACVLRRKGFSWTIQTPIQVPIRVPIEDSTHESTSSSSFQFPKAHNTVVYACVLRRKGFSWTIQTPIQIPIRVPIEDSTHHPPKQNDPELGWELGQTFMTSQG